MQVRRLIQGTSPLLISFPHVGTFVPPDIKRRLTPAGLQLPDTDWHTDRLYQFAEAMGASLLTATHARYVVDLNRPQDDASLYPGQLKTGLCPLETFEGEALYQDGEEPDDIEKINRVAAYWLPYHETLQEELARLKREHGHAILYDAHSIRSHVPRLFGGQLPDLNLGTAKGTSCNDALAQAVLAAMGQGSFTSVRDGRFTGGYITRHYGRPQDNIHALQMELTRVNYMDEDQPYLYRPEKAEKLQEVLKKVIAAALAWKP